MAEAGGWIEFSQPCPDARLKLYCFPYAGGAAQAYRLWHREIPPDVQVCPIQPPGRWSRLREPPLRRMEPLVQAVTDALVPTMDRPFALFGHSLGGLVAFEVARALRRRGGPFPEHLFVSGRRAPHLGNPHAPMDGSSDDEFVRLMQDRYGGIPEEVLASRELLQILLPAIRADMEVYDHYSFVDEPPLELPVTVYGGEADRTTPRAELELWSGQTTGAFRLQTFPGGHFFLATAKEAFFADLLQELRKTR